MAIDIYAPCPCGSGKKFKWCCQPIHAEMGRIFAMDEAEQHEAALRAVEAVIAQHPTNAEAHGRKAQLCFQNDRVEEAEAALNKAFELFPNYPFGHFLKARFHLHAEQYDLSLKHLRAAARHYDPSVGDMLAGIYTELFRMAVERQQWLTARAAAAMAQAQAGANANLDQGVAQLFSPDNPDLPACVKTLHAFKPMPGVNLSSPVTGQKALEEITEQLEARSKSPVSPPAVWYNLGLCHAWLGNSAAAVIAYQNFDRPEPDEQIPRAPTVLTEARLLDARMQAAPK